VRSERTVLEKHDTATALRGALLNPSAGQGVFVLARHPPSEALRRYVRHFWFVRWDREGLPPHTQSTLPLPGTNAVIERDRQAVYGFATKRFEIALNDKSAAFGVLFRPAGFYAFFGRSMHELVDRSLPCEEVFGSPSDLLRDFAFSTEDDAAIVREYEAYLLSARIVPSAEADLASEWAERVERDPSIGRADALAKAVGVGLRTLQRAMRHYIGATPKQIIRRYRLLEAAGRLIGGEEVDCARLAFDLGYHDQAHFTRDFTAAVGRSPHRYASAEAQLRGGRPGT
jgi:AraC-like DNA-binding protein